MEEGTVLGYLISTVGIPMDLAKIKVILHFPIPKTPTQVHIFIGCISYYRRFIENFAKIEHPLFQLETKDANFVWTDDCDATFMKIKEHVYKASILQGLD